MYIRLHENAASPLRYSGGDYRSASLKVNLRPKKVSEWREAFGGGASMTLTMRRRHLAETYWLNDIDPNLVNFWKVLQSHPDKLVSLLMRLRKQYGQGSNALFDFATAMTSSDDNVEAAAGFWVRNRLSYGGMNGMSSYSPSRENDNRGIMPHFIDSLYGFSELLQGVKITNLDYHEILNAEGENVFVYLDPPFENVGERLYRNGSMDFDSFSEAVHQCPHNCLVKVNDSPANQERFSDMSPIVRDYHSSMGKHSVKSELLAANYTTPLYQVYGQQIGRLLDTTPKRQLPTHVQIGEDKKHLFLNKGKQKRCVEWYTPLWLLKHFYTANGGIPFDLDPCSPVKGSNAPVWANQHFTLEDDGLKQNWNGRVFLNPPYNKIAPWVEKAADAVWCQGIPMAPTEASSKREQPFCETIIALIPARTHTRWWEQYVRDHARVFFISGKVKFRTGEAGHYQEAKTGFPEGLAIVIWGNHQPFTDYLSSLPASQHNLADRSHLTIPDLPYEYYWKHQTLKEVA